MARSRRVLVPGIDPADGARVVLPRDEAHHLIRVLRLHEGDSVWLFDGAGREWSATLSRVEGGSVEADVGAERLDPVEAPLDVRLFQGLCRYDRVEWAIQKATEVGVRSVTVAPVSRSDVAPPPPRRRERWARLAAEACKQCGRRAIPAVAFADAFPDPGESGVLALLLDPGAGAAPLGGVLDRERPRETWIAVGPEGGFSVEEVRDLTASGWVPTGFGPRILRTETAGVVAASLVLHRWGDLGPAPLG
jgi:16S rRNA (uracil1498-N3)-methyltransferase